MEKFQGGSVSRQSPEDPKKVWERIANDSQSYEREKTAGEIEIIHDADRRTSRVIESYGAPPSAVTPEMVHVVSEEKWPGGHAFTSREHGVFVPENDDLDLFKMMVVHELFHQKGVNFLPIPLTEAIVERLTTQALNLEKEILKGSAIFSGTYTYPDLRIALDDLLKAVQSKVQAGTTNDFHSFSFFAKAHLTGNIEHLRFLDTVFGPGTLEELNRLDDDPNSLSSFIKNL